MISSLMFSFNADVRGVVPYVLNASKRLIHSERNLSTTLTITATSQDVRRLRMRPMYPENASSAGKAKTTKSDDYNPACVNAQAR